MRVAGDVWNTGRYGTNLVSGGVLLVRGTMVVWPGVEVVAGGGAAEEMQEEASDVADGSRPRALVSLLYHFH